MCSWPPRRDWRRCGLLWRCQTTWSWTWLSSTAPTSTTSDCLRLADWFPIYFLYFYFWCYQVQHQRVLRQIVWGWQIDFLFTFFTFTFDTIKYSTNEYYLRLIEVGISCLLSLLLLLILSSTAPTSTMSDCLSLADWFPIYFLYYYFWYYQVQHQWVLPQIVWGWQIDFLFTFFTFTFDTVYRYITGDLNYQSCIQDIFTWGGVQTFLSRGTMFRADPDTFSHVYIYSKKNFKISKF